jgi:succinate dehydrogenase hydrophobic anchor subunit
MKSKQLANVLIKLLGLSLCAQSVMHFLSGLWNIFTDTRRPIISFNFLSGAVLVAIGIFLVIKSRDVAGFLFKNEED